ncbi:MAG: hypothetical protein HYX27_14010 [Acidobacteria bacterium]|nr:hypothetical protein [Acidobacteriota bacterium]
MQFADQEMRVRFTPGRRVKATGATDGEFEVLLISNPDVPEEEAGEVPKAFDVRRSEISTAELSDFVTARVAPFKKIRQWEFID